MFNIPRTVQQKTERASQVMSEGTIEQLHAKRNDFAVEAEQADIDTCWSEAFCNDSNY